MIYSVARRERHPKKVSGTFFDIVRYSKYYESRF